MAQHDVLFERTFHDSPIGMLIADEGGAVVSTNHALAQLLGYDSEALRGCRADAFTHPDDLERDRALALQLAAGETSTYEVSKRVIHRSGDVVWTRSTVSRVVDPAGAVYFVAQISDITELRKANEVLAGRALHDPLTGLANRALVMDRLSLLLDCSRADVSTVACLFLDIDHFTLINDSLGHEVGDDLLIELSRRMQHAVRPGDTVARLGGDEFVIILEDIAHGDEAEELLANISASLQAPIMMDGREVVVTVSAGIALAEPGITAETLMRNADTAMAYAKNTGRDRTAVFSEQLRESALVRLSIETELRAAIRKGELVVHYQPIVDLASGDTVALEALVRWDHPTRGLLLPHFFIDVCEDANLVVPMGAFVLREACRLIAERPDFTGRVLVNVSTRQIGSADLTRVVREALDETGVDPSRLGLEITESGMLLASQAAHADLSALTEMGIDLIIDDFGTGYSALSSVLQNPVSAIKLAREFTLRLGDRSTGDRISTAVANLVDSLGMYGVIEGVETEAQRRQALGHGWKLGQGFLFSRPVPADQLDIPGTAPARDHVIAG